MSDERHRSALPKENPGGKTREWRAAKFLNTGVRWTGAADPLVLVTAFVLINLLLIGLTVFRPGQEKIVQAEEIEHIEGFAYRAYVDLTAPFPYRYVGDLAENPRQSNLVLLEDGQRFSRPHTVHQSVIDTPNAGYSHWANTLVFGTTRGDDPRSNGRTYSYNLRAEIIPALFWTILAIEVALSLLMAVELQGNIRWFGFLGATGVCVLAVNFMFLGSGYLPPLLAPDTGTYMDLENVARSIGYPLIIQAALASFGSVDWLVPIQLNGLLFAFAALAFAIGHTFGNWLYSSLTIVVLSLDFGVLNMSTFILTEAAFVFFVCLYLAASILAIRRFHWLIAFAAGLSLGAAIAVRPGGYALLLGVPLMAMWWREKWLRVLLGLGAPTGLILLSAATFNYVHKGFWGGQIFSGTSMLGAVGELIRFDPAGRYPALSRRIADANVSVLAQVKDRSWPKERWIANQRLFNPLLTTASPIIFDEVARLGPHPRTIDVMLLYDKIAVELGIAAILNNPLEYAVIVSANYFGAWMNLFVPQSPVARQRLDRYRQNKSNLLVYGALPIFEGKTDTEIYRDAEFEQKLESEEAQGTVYDVATRIMNKTKFFTRFLAVSVGFTALLVLFARILVRKNLSPQAFVLFFIAVQVHASFLLFSMASTAVQRYSEVFEPFVSVLIVGAAGLTIQTLYAWLDGAARNSRRL